MTDQAVNTVWAADYLPFGQADVTLATVENNLRFSGQYYDSETGLHYNYHRYYDPQLGRYLRADPIGIEGGLNPYRFVENNPILNRDINGLECVKLFSFTIPSGITKTSQLKERGNWEFAAPPHAELSMSTGKIFGKIGPIVSNLKTGLALCFAKRKLIYEDTYTVWGTKIEGGICYNDCDGLKPWSKESEVILSDFTRERTDWDKNDAAIKIAAPVDFLANVACTNWLRSLR